jgi:hypothetical protein
MPFLELVRPSDWFLVPSIHCFPWLRWILTFFTDFVSRGISFAMVDWYARLSWRISLFVSLSSLDIPPCSSRWRIYCVAVCCLQSLCLMRSMVCWLNLSRGFRFSFFKQLVLAFSSACPNELYITWLPSLGWTIVGVSGSADIVQNYFCLIDPPVGSLSYCGMGIFSCFW